MNSDRVTLKGLPRATAITLVIGSAVLIGSIAANGPASAGAALTPLAISQIPLTVSTAAHPQVLIALGNSESMDGTLSGAIMTGSGSLNSGLDTLKASSSPATYAVPAGFAPPLQAADASGNAPYTVASGAGLADNGASRLNVAKAGIQAIIGAYIQNTDFALETYSTSGTNLYTTWVYYMSPPGSGFNFTSTQLAGRRYVANPCYGYTTASSTVKNNCGDIVTKPNPNLYVSATVVNALYMEIGASSDDPNINDVLYAGSQPGVYINYGGTSPATPFPPNFSITNYNNGNILISYAKSAPSANTATGPTNAGYVPFSPEVMYAQRGFGYGGSQSATSGNVVVTMKSSGTTPTNASVATAVAAFTPLLQPETNIQTTGEIKAVAGQAPTAGLLAKAKTYLAGITTSNTGCVPQQYVVLISDGLPTQDLAGKYWPPLGSAAANGYGVSASFNADGTLASTNDQALTDTIASLTALRTAGVKTFIIGLGAGVDATLNPQAAATLQAMALAGGNISAANGKAYYPATSPAELVAELNSILLSVQAGTLSTSAASVNTTRLQSSSREYQASFISKDAAYQDWTGNLQSFTLDPTTGIPGATAVWSAQGQLDTLVSNGGWSGTRLVATWNPAAGSGASATPARAAPFQWSSLTPGQQSLLQPSDTLGQSRLEYIRGNTGLEKRNGGTFRNRSHILGDIVDSQSAYVGPPSGLYYSTSYRTFVQSKAARQPMLYVGANDGMLHAFNATTGAEQFAFVPYGVFANLDNLSDPLYNQSHLFFVDGSPQAGDVQFSDASWHTVLVGGLGGGGRSIYALDVTNPAGITSEAALASAVLWEFSDAADLGLTYSEPRIAQINAAPNFAVFFGNGYNSTGNKAVLYAVNPATGAQIAKIDLCAAVTTACNASLPQGLSTVAVGNSDGQLGQPITQLYAGDLQGNLWAIDVSSATPGNWSVRLLAQARDAGGAVQPITIAPLVTLHPKFPTLQGLFVLFGTGQLLTVGDLSSSQTQSIYGIWDKAGSSTVVARSALQAQTLSNSVSGGVTYTNATTTQIDWTSKRGWYVDLIVSGQRLVTGPKLLNGAFLATLNTPPPANSCTATFTSQFMELNFTTGGAFDTPQLDANQDGLINANDQIAGKNPVSINLAGGYASAPTILGRNSRGLIDVHVTLSGGGSQTLPVLDRTSHVTRWWQIK